MAYHTHFLGCPLQHCRIHPCILNTPAYWTPLHTEHPAHRTPLHTEHPCILNTPTYWTPLHTEHPCILNTPAHWTPLHTEHPAHWTPCTLNTTAWHYIKAWEQPVMSTWFFLIVVAFVWRHMLLLQLRCALSLTKESSPWNLSSLTVQLNCRTGDDDHLIEIWWSHAPRAY